MSKPVRAWKLRAVASFDAERFPQFEPYAKTRIRGAILDELRANDSLTRYGRERMGQVTKTIRTLQQELGRPPDETEIVERRADDTRDFLDLGPLHAGNGVEIDAQLVGMIEIVVAHRMRV